MKKKWRNFFRVLMISPAPVLFPTEQEKYESYEESLARQPDGMPAPFAQTENHNELYLDDVTAAEYLDDAGAENEPEANGGDDAHGESGNCSP